jgi:hypothetical protein
VYDTIVSSAGQSLSGQAEKRSRRVPIEPFPIFIVPQAYPGRLLTVVGERLALDVDSDPKGFENL